MPISYNPQISISAAPGVTQYLYLVLYEALTPTVPVANSGQLAPPHNSSRQLVFYNLRPVIHLASLFITNGVDVVGTLIANFELDPRFPAVEIRPDWHIYADETDGFESGTNFFADPTEYLDGWDYSLEVRGFGTLDPDTDKQELRVATPSPSGYTIPSLDGGESTYVIQPGEHHVIHFKPKISIYTPVDTGGELFTGTEIITADYAVPAGKAGVMHQLQSATSTLALTLPNIAMVPANKLFLFNSQGGQHINAVIDVEGSNDEVIEWLGGELSQLILGQSEQLWLYRWINPDDNTDTRWLVAHALEDTRSVGQKVYSDIKEDLINMLFADGRELDREVYARLWAYVQTLPADMLVDEATWNAANDVNKGKYSTADGSSTFRIPDLRIKGFLRGVDGSGRLAGSLQVEMVGPHRHFGFVDKQIGPTGSFPPTLTAINAPVKIYSKDGSGKESYYMGGDNDEPTVGRTSTGGGTENRPANVGQYILIRV